MSNQTVLKFHKVFAIVYVIHLLLGVNIVSADEIPKCTEGEILSHGAGIASAVIRNNTAEDCEGGLASYVDNTGNIDNQTGHSKDTGTVSAGSELTFNVTLPRCYQLDLFGGKEIWPTFGGQRYGDDLIQSRHDSNPRPCDQNQANISTSNVCVSNGVDSFYTVTVSAVGMEMLVNGEWLGNGDTFTMAPNSSETYQTRHLDGFAGGPSSVTVTTGEACGNSSPCLDTGSFTISLWHDANENGAWDTGEIALGGEPAGDPWKVWAELNGSKKVYPTGHDGIAGPIVITKGEEVTEIGHIVPSHRTERGENWYITVKRFSPKTFGRCESDRFFIGLNIIDSPDTLPPTGVRAGGADALWSVALGALIAAVVLGGLAYLFYNKHD